MKIYLARHGQTNYNEARLCNADPRTNVFLTQKGIQQVYQLAQTLKHVKFQHIFVSELLRTKQTADAVNKFHLVPITIDPRLNDNDSGFEGKPADEYYAALNAAPNKWEARFNGGESIADVKQRVASFVNDLKSSNHEAVFIVSSKIVIQLFQGIVNNLSYEDLWNLKVERGGCAELEI